ncbi:MAG TPA: HPr family phosphocarrier protein [Chthoniobacterales bacterium]|nr:HPr family phosphocarrier protein [Chthoniobacterales bacterium]
MKLPRRHQHAIVSATREISIRNASGLHARPAAEFARCANRFQSEIWIVKSGARFSASSLIDIMRANLAQGTTVTLEAKGSDADAALEALAQLVDKFRD